MRLPLRVLSLAALAATWLTGAAKPGTVEIGFVAVPASDGSSAALSPGDLKLSDNGKELPVASLWKIAPAVPASTLPPHTFANRTGVEKAQNATVVFLDGVNTQWRNDASGREETTRALQQIRPGERVAILVFGKTLRLLSDFSDSPAVREAKVKEFGAGKSATTPVAATPVAATPVYADLVLPVNLTGRVEMYQEQERLTSTYNALGSIAAMLRTVPGRKNLLWISGDFPLLLGRPDDPAFGLTGSTAVPDADMQRIQKLGYNKAADDLIAALNKAGVAVYPVDARKVSLDPLRRASHVNTITTTSSGEAGTIDDIMQHLAERTGGAPFAGNKELGEHLRGAMDDAQNAYILSFTPPASTPDAVPHKLKLQAAKAKSYQIRVCPVYYPPAAPAPPGDANARLSAALAAALDIPEISLTARVEPDASTGALVVSLDIDARDLQLERKGEDWIGVIGLGIVQGNSAGEQFGRQLQSGGATIHAPDYAKTMQTGSGIHFDFKVKREPRATFLRFGIIDQKTRNSGSLTVPL